MGNQTARNYHSYKYAGVAATYVEVTEQFTSYFSVYAPAEGLLLSLGHASPADATSIEIAAGGAFDLDTGMVGKIFIKSLTGVPLSAQIVGA